MTTTVQQCYNDILTTQIRVKFNHYKPYQEQGLNLVNSGKKNIYIAADLDYLAGSTGEFTNMLKQMSFSASMLKGGHTLYSPDQFDSVTITEAECITIKELFA